MSQAELTPPLAYGDDAGEDLGRALQQRSVGLQWYIEKVIESLLFLAAASSVLITVGIVVVLLEDAAQFFLNNYNLSLAPVPVEKREQVAEALTQSAGWRIEDARKLVESPGQVVLNHLQQAEAARVREAFAAHGVGADQTRAPLFGEFVSQTQWSPQFAQPKHGIWPLVAGTFVTTVLALFVAVPIGTVCAIWLSEYARPRIRETIKPVLELLAAVPTVVYGFFALLFVTPLLQKVIPGLPSFNMLSAGLVMGVMIIPYVSSLSEDAMRAVPMHMREGSYAVGATKMQTAFRVIFPSAFSGITAAYILGISRAVGETMVVAIAAGTQPQLTFDPTSQGATITAYIVQVSQGDLPEGSRGYNSIYAAGLTLLALTLTFNIAGYWLRKRYREAY